MTSSWMLYGAYGATGQRIAEEAVRRGHRPLLAGRSEPKLRPLAERLGLSYRVLTLDDPDTLREALRPFEAVLHTAGPFVQTSAPMVAACLEAKTHYLDITGEVPALEAIFAKHEAAVSAGVALLPAVGFDVVPSDCLALHLAKKVAPCRRLEVAIWLNTQPTVGTAKSILGIFARGGAVRVNGELRHVPLGVPQKRLSHHGRTVTVIGAPVADLVTAFHSTGAKDITTYSTVSASVAKLARVASPLLSHALRLSLVRRVAETAVERRFRHEPTDRHGQARIWALAEGLGGQRAEGWVTTPEPYLFTATSAVRAMELTLQHKPVGALSPAQAFGEAFLTSLAGAALEEVPQAHDAPKASG